MRFKLVSIGLSKEDDELNNYLKEYLPDGSKWEEDIFFNIIGVEHRLTGFYAILINNILKDTYKSMYFKNNNLVIEFYNGSKIILTDQHN